jgi:beta-mannanase
MWYEGWTGGGFDGHRVAAVAAQGAVPMITWEPWDWQRGIDQPAFSLARISAGDHDDYVGRWARSARDFGDQILVRFAHEMNARYYPWSAGANGNRSEDYVTAWRHVVQIFRDAGADNVRWVWSPNVSYDGTTPLHQLYPGDDWVDWVAVDGYNGGAALPWGGWLDFDAVFGPTLDEIERLTTAKPVMIGETASAEAGGDKAAWIHGLFDAMERRPAIRAFVWFNHDKETDWRIQSSARAQEAFAQRVADDRYS